MSSIYAILPRDLQRIVASYLPLWERIGLKKEPKLKHDSNVYFCHIRRAPRGSFWNPEFPTSLYYRQQRHFFEFIIRVRPENSWTDQWTILIQPQFEEISLHHLHCLKQTLPIWSVPFPENANLVELWHVDMERNIGLEFCSRRETEYQPPTRQKMAVGFVNYVRKLSPLVHQKYREIKISES